jgi:hypothetical protein
MTRTSLRHADESYGWVAWTEGRLSSSTLREGSTLGESFLTEKLMTKDG